MRRWGVGDEGGGVTVVGCWGWCGGGDPGARGGRRVEKSVWSGNNSHKNASLSFYFLLFGFLRCAFAFRSVSRDLYLSVSLLIYLSLY